MGKNIKSPIERFKNLWCAYCRGCANGPGEVKKMDMIGREITIIDCPEGERFRRGNKQSELCVAFIPHALECDSTNYIRKLSSGVCSATKDTQECYCHGYKINCDFYDQIRKEGEKIYDENNCAYWIECLKKRGYKVIKEF